MKDAEKPPLTLVGPSMLPDTQIFWCSKIVGQHLNGQIMQCLSYFDCKNLKISKFPIPLL